MANGGKGTAVGKVYIETALVDNFKQIAGQIKSGLGNGLKDLKDLELSFGFNDKQYAKAVSAEIQEINKLLNNNKLKQLDYSFIMPSLTSALSDDTLTDSIKYQIVQGFRQGLDAANKTLTSANLQSIMNGKGADKSLMAIGGYTAVNDIIASLGLKQNDSKLLLKNYYKAAGGAVNGDVNQSKKQLAQLMSLVDVKNANYSDALRYLVDVKSSQEQLNTTHLTRLSNKNLTKNDAEKISGVLERIQYLTEHGSSESIAEAKIAQMALNKSQELQSILEQIQKDSELAKAASGMRTRVREASEIKDIYYQNRKSDIFKLDRHPVTLLSEFAEELTGTEGVYSKLAPLITHKFPKESSYSVDKLFEETMRSMRADKSLETKTVVRAEQAADRAELALGKITKVVEERKQDVGESKVEKDVKKAEISAESAEMETVSEEKKESSIKTWKELEKAENKYNKLRDKLVETWKEQEDLYKQIDEAQTKASEAESNLKQITIQQKGREQDIGVDTRRKEAILERINNNQEELKEVEKELDGINKQRTKLKKSLENYNAETQKILEDNEDYQNLEENKARRDTLVDEQKRISKTITSDKKDLAALKYIAGNKTNANAKGEELALNLLQERADKLKDSNSKYDNILKEYNAASEAKQNILLPQLQQAEKQVTLSQVEFLKAFQNARERKVADKNLIPFMKGNANEYGFDFQTLRKDGKFRKDADKTIQQQLDNIIKPIQEAIAKKTVELEKLKEQSKENDLELQALYNEIKSGEEASRQRESGAKQIQNEIAVLDKKENSKLTAKTRLENRISQNREVLNQPKYTTLEESQKEVEEGRQLLEQAKHEADEASKELSRVTKAHKKKKEQLLKQSQELHDLQEDIDLGQTNLLNTEIEASVETIKGKNKKSKKEPLQDRREYLETKRKELEEELKKDNEVITESESKKQSIQQEIDKITNEQNDILQQRKDKNNIIHGYDSTIKQTGKELADVQKKLASLRERQQRLIEEKRTFDQETARLLAQDDYDTKSKIAEDIKKKEQDVENRKNNLSLLMQETEEMNKMINAAPQERGLALDELKQAAKANKQAYEELIKAQSILNSTEFKTPEEKEIAQQKYNLAKEKGTQSYATYFSAVENAIESKVGYEFLSRYTDKQFDPNNLFDSSEVSYIYDHYGKKELELFKELQKILDERKKYIEKTQKEVTKQREDVTKLRQDLLGKNWTDVNPEARAQESAKKQITIDSLSQQEKELVEKEKEAQINLDNAKELSSKEKTAIDELDKKNKPLAEKIKQLQEDNAKEEESYNRLVQLRDEKKRRLQRIQDNEDLLNQAEEEITNRLQGKSKKESPVQEKKESIEDNPVVEQANEEIKEVEETTKQLEDRKKELEDKIKNLNSLVESFPSEEDYEKYYGADSAKTYSESASAAEDPVAAAAKQLREHGKAFKQTIKNIKAQEKEMKSMDKESVEYKKAEENLQRLQNQYIRDWVAMYYSHEELGEWGITKDLGSDKERQTYNKWVPERQGDKEHPFSKENLEKMLERLQEQKNRKKELETELAKYKEELKSLTKEKPQEKSPIETVEATTPETTPIAESASEQSEAIIEETEEITEKSDEIIEELQHEEEALKESAEEIHEQQERTEEARENYEEAVVGSKTQSKSSPQPQPQEQNKTDIDNKNSNVPLTEESKKIEQTTNDLRAKRDALIEEIRKSEQTMNEAEKEIKTIDNKMDFAQAVIDESNKRMEQPHIKHAELQAYTREEALQREKQTLERIVKERKELEEQLKDVFSAQQSQKNAKNWLNYIDGFTGENPEKADRLRNIPFTEKGKPQKKEAAKELRRIGQLYLEHRNKEGYHTDQTNGIWQDAYTVLHHRAMEQAKKHQVAGSILDRETFDTDDEVFYKDSLKKLHQERDMYQGFYDEAQKIIEENRDKIKQLKTLKRQEEDTQTSIKQYENELEIVNKNVVQHEELETDIQNKKDELKQLQEQREKQQAIYDEAINNRQENLRRLEEIENLIEEEQQKQSKINQNQQNESDSIIQQERQPNTPDEDHKAGLLPNTSKQEKEHVESLHKEAEEAKIDAQAQRELVNARKEASQVAPEGKKGITDSKQNLLKQLETAETKLQKIQERSENLANIDPDLQKGIELVNIYLEKIKELKKAINDDSSKTVSANLAGDTKDFLSMLNGQEINGEKKIGAIDVIDHVTEKSETDFKRMSNNFGKYATAIKKLFDDMAKGSSMSFLQLQEDMNKVGFLADKLSKSTGLAKGELLTGTLNSKISPQVDDAQTEALSKVSIAYEAMYTKLVSKAENAQSQITKIFGENGVVDLEKNFASGNLKGFDNFATEAKNAENALQTLLECLAEIASNPTWAMEEENVAKVTNAIKQLDSSLDQVKKDASNFKIVDDLEISKLSASANQFIRNNPALTGKEVSEIRNYIDQLQSGINKVDFDNIKKGLESVKQKAIEAGHTGDTFFSMLIQRFKSLGAYLLSFVSFYEVINVFKQGIGIIHELDDALTEMQKVSDESLGTLREYQKGTFATANDIGTTASQLQQSTADWLRLGEDLQQASQSAQTANVLFNVSEFENINDATTALVAMSAAYADAEKDIDKMDIVDRLNLIGNNYAIATDELATALQDGAATLQTAGNDLDEAIALTTAGNEKIA